jgi:hypothetical protein
MSGSAPDADARRHGAGGGRARRRAADRRDGARRDRLRVCGLGIANAVPLLFSAAGRFDPPGPSLAATFTIGYTGFIVGPPLIGLLADRFGLPSTLGLLVIAALAVAALGGRATATKPTMSSPDGDPPTVAPELEAAIH